MGKGYSNVSIIGRYLYCIGQKDYKKDTIFCLNVEDGKEVWQYSYKSNYEPQTTPTLDGKYLYTLSTDGHLYCFKAKDGKVRWKKNIVEEYGAIKPYFNGFSGSPVIEGDLIILTTNKSGMALNKKTGKMVKILKPKILIPHHWDNFLPPISRTENLEPLLKLMNKKFPNIEVLIPEFEEEMTINI